MSLGLDDLLRVCDGQLGSALNEEVNPAISGRLLHFIYEKMIYALASRKRCDVTQRCQERWSYERRKPVPIIVKKVCGNGSIEDIWVSDDPTDQELIDALGGQGNLVTEKQWEDQWEILKSTESDDYLIVGVPPHISADSPKRKTCNLSDQQAKNIVRAIVDQSI